MAGHGLPINLEFLGDPPLGPLLLTQTLDGVDESHLELIRHTKPPSKGFFGGSLGGKSSSQKWLVFRRPEVAGFGRSMTSKKAEIAGSFADGHNRRRAERPRRG